MFSHGRHKPNFRPFTSNWSHCSHEFYISKTCPSSEHCKLYEKIRLFYFLLRLHAKGLIAESSKTNTIKRSKKRSFNKPSYLEMNGSKISSEKDIEIKFCTFVSAMHQTIPRWWYNDKSILHIFYPHLIYGIEFYGHAAKCHLNQILILQKAAVRVILKIRPRSHVYSKLKPYKLCLLILRLCGIGVALSAEAEIG